MVRFAFENILYDDSLEDAMDYIRRPGMQLRDDYNAPITDDGGTELK